METKAMFPLVIGLILAGVVLGVGVLVLQNFEETELTTTTVSAENITLINSTAVNLAHDRVIAVSLVNVTGNVTLAAANYTVGSTGLEGTYGTITLASTAAVYNGSWALITYTYDADSGASADIDSTESAISSIASDWLPIIVIAAAAAIVLFLIMGAIGTGSKR